MKRRPRIHYTECQKALMWERWQKGESLQQIAQLFDRNHSSIQQILAAPQSKLNAIARRLNERPRKTLNYETPAERFHQSVASTS
jgi:IS30 family transposase